MTFGDSLLQALGTGLCERSVPPIHSRRSRLCGPAAHSRALVRSLRNSGKCLRIASCWLTGFFRAPFGRKGTAYISVFSQARGQSCNASRRNCGRFLLFPARRAFAAELRWSCRYLQAQRKNRNSRCARFDCPEEPVGLQWPNPNYREYMGDKSRKEVHKKALQKRIKDDAAVHEKQAMTEDQHHPTSGHTATPGHPTTSDERDPPRPQTDQPSGKNERRMDRPKWRIIKSRQRSLDPWLSKRAQK